MNLEILFRGKRLDNGQWVHGYYIYKQDPLLPGIDAYFIVTLDENSMSVWNKVDPATVGQWTGLTDRAGKRIFEGDILSRDCYDASGRIVKVVWAEELAQFSAQMPSGYGFSMLPPNGKVIGNVYDHPEILNGETKNGEN